MLNLSSLMPQEQKEMTSVLHLKHPVTNELLELEDGSPLTIELMGMESAVAKNIVKARSQKMMNSRKGLKLDIDEAMSFNANLLSKLTVGWTNISDDDTMIEFSKAAAHDLYMKHSWLRDQVDEFVTDRENFFKA